MGKEEPFGEGDPHYLALSFVVTCIIQLSCFFVAYSCSFDLITDFAGSINFVLLGLLSLCLGGSYTKRQVAVTSLLTVSRLELALFLLYRVCSRKKDARFDDTRNSFVKFLVFWVFQIFWVYLVSFPVFWVNSVTETNPDLGWLDYVGWTTWVIGFFSQLSSDFQKLLFRKDPANKLEICKRGLWSYSRHPNYFGEIMMWWGIFISTIPVWLDNGEEDGWATVVSPVFTMLILLFLSGMPTAEGKALERWYSNGDELRSDYENYRNRTAPIVPCCPPIYAVLPHFVKCLFCCEFRRYEYPGAESKALTRV
mmetsp:Transcript_61404/g.85413  ORF Transcript_61404/g.85413 Transcript_61404/m.85413 type:complete len:310 (-) Transcript_61404:35-964(-)